MIPMFIHKLDQSSVADGKVSLNLITTTTKITTICYKENKFHFRFPSIHTKPLYLLIKMNLAFFNFDKSHLKVI